jgi:hypothetical protein
MSLLLIALFWGVLFAYPLFQGWAIWRSRGVWRKVACTILALAGSAYLWCIWWLFVWPKFTPPSGPLYGLLEMIALSCGGPVVLLILVVIVVLGRPKSLRISGGCRR